MGTLISGLPSAMSCWEVSVHQPPLLGGDTQQCGCWAGIPSGEAAKGTSRTRRSYWRGDPATSRHLAVTPRSRAFGQQTPTTCKENTIILPLRESQVMKYSGCFVSSLMMMDLGWAIHHLRRSWPECEVHLVESSNGNTKLELNRWMSHSSCRSGKERKKSPT